MSNEEIKNDIVYIIKCMAISVIIAAIFAILVNKYILTLTIVNGESMSPNISNGEKLIISKLSHINRYDVVVFQPEKEKPLYIKRVIGLPGETVEIIPTLIDKEGKIIRKSTILINNIPLEDDIYHLEDELKWGILKDKKIILNSNEYFVLGDNRNDSEDSRIIGAVELSSIEGVIVGK